MINPYYPLGNTVLSSISTPIKSVHDVDGSGNNYVVGSKGVTEIVSYDENGEMASIPWLAVMTADGVWVRMPARNMAVYYQ
jgi:hypothetical protein